VDFFIAVSTLVLRLGRHWFDQPVPGMAFLICDCACLEGLVPTIARIEPLSEAGALPTVACNVIKRSWSSNFSFCERMTP
jgi:hypothetical protein